MVELTIVRGNVGDVTPLSTIGPLRHDSHFDVGAACAYLRRL